MNSNMHPLMYVLLVYLRDNVFSVCFVQWSNRYSHHEDRDFALPVAWLGTR